MKTRSFAILAAATAVGVAAAAWAVVNQPAPVTVRTDGEKMFPALAANLNDAVEIEVVSHKAQFTVRREGERWGVKEKGGYPVKFEPVKSVLVGLSELGLFEAKTSDPARYARLAVEDPETEDAASRRVIVRDREGRVLAAAIVGRTRPNLLGGSGGGTYLRRDGEARTWLAQGEVQIGGEPRDWLDREIVNILSENVAALHIRRADGEEIIARRPKQGERNLVVENVPEGKRLKSEQEANHLASGMWRLNLEDVMAEAEFDFPETFHVTELTTFDGLVARAEIVERDEHEYWARFRASADNATGDEDAVKALQERAEAINRRAEGWVYRLSVGEGETLSYRLSRLIEDVPPEGS